MTDYKIVDIKASVFAHNNEHAEKVRTKLKENKQLFINLMSSPGSGKTTTLTKVISELKGKLQCAVMEADIDGDCDAATIQEKTGAKVIQIHTDGMCHLDSGMTEEGLNVLDAKDANVIFLENIGNLVCPAEFDTGASKNVMILSVPEGDDKPLKYPLMFSVCDLIIINKIDTISVFDFSVDKVKERVHKLNPNTKILTISAKTNEGVSEVAEWIENEYKEWIK